MIISTIYYLIVYIYFILSINIFLSESMKFGYWKLRGRGQVGRLILSYCGLDFE